MTDAGLRSLALQPEYRRGHADMVNDFYVPCLGLSRQYDRAAGYFTSTSLALVAAGLSAFLAHDGVMRLIASPVLDRDDIAALEAGVQAKGDLIARALMKAFDLADSDAIVRDRLGFLAWLIAEDRLQIRIASVEGHGIYHEKFGVFVDGDSNGVAFTGSPNETAGGLVANFESIDVYTSWSADAYRVDLKRQAFEALWADKMPGVRTSALPDAVRRRILQFRPPRLQSHDPLEEDHLATSGEQPPGAAKETGAPYARDYQLEAVRCWEEAGHRGVFAMATGTGKTLTALLAVERLRHLHKATLLVVVAPYIHLVDQWSAEMQRFGWPAPVLCYGSSASWAPKLSGLVSDLGLGLRPFGTCVVTQAGLGSAEFKKVLSASQRVHRVIVGDEVHGLGSPAAAATLSGLDFQSRLGLSATPERWKDEETESIYSYFGPVVFEFDLEAAIGQGFLVPYRYYPHFVELSTDEFGRYVEVSRRLARAMAAASPSDIDPGSGPIGSLLRRRSLILNGASQKAPSLRELLEPMASLRYALVYTTPEQIDEVVDAVSNSGRRIVHRFTFRETARERQALLKAFGDGHMDVLVAIRCLDQGVDVPRTEIAFITASSSNSREFIQRRGRILRRAEGKSHATIHDFITLPPKQSGDPSTWAHERGLVRREILRFKEFAQSATNRFEAEAQLLELQELYGLFDV